MGKLTAEDEATLAELLARRDAPEDAPEELLVRDGDREYRITGPAARRALKKLGLDVDDDDQGGAAAPVKKAAAKKTAAKKPAPAPPEDDDQEGEEGEEGEGEEEPAEEVDPGTATKKHWYFGR